MEFKFNVGDKVRMVDDLDDIHCNDTGIYAKYGEIIEIDKTVDYDDEMPYLVLFIFNDHKEYPLWCEERQLELIED